MRCCNTTAVTMALHLESRIPNHGLRITNHGFLITPFHHFGGPIARRSRSLISLFSPFGLVFATGALILFLSFFRAPVVADVCDCCPVAPAGFCAAPVAAPLVPAYPVYS